MKRANMMVLVILIIAFREVPAACAQNTIEPMASIIAHVVDEDGNPVMGAKAGAGFEVLKSSGIGTESIGHEDITNANGDVISSGRTYDGHAFLGAVKEGFYRTSGIKYIFKEQKDGHWQPQNPAVTILLKSIVKPVPLYAKRIATKVPVDLSPVAFDLEIGDWVAPYGMGKQMI